MNNILASGYDNELTCPEEDLLDRKLLAHDILNNIIDTPTDWSVRVGIYGQWGTGKTTLLNFLKNAAEEKDYLYFSFNPTLHETSNDMWSAFYAALLNNLEDNNFDISNALPLSKWKTYLPESTQEKLSSSRWVQKTTKYLFKAQDWANSIKKNISSKTASSALSFVQQQLKIGSIFFDDLKKQLNGKKIIIAIDDIDRVADSEAKCNSLFLA